MGTLTEAVPEELRELERWVCAGDETKRPLCCFGERAASVSDPRTWGTFEEASQAVACGRFPWAGFVFAGDGLVGIDIDCGFDELGMPTEEAVEAIEACRSYTEVSRSGKGFHIICRGDIPFKGANNRQGWEIYKDARYFVLTGMTVGYTEIADAQGGIDLVVERHFRPVTDIDRDRGGGERIWEPEWRRPENGRVPLEPTYPVVTDGCRHLSLVSACGALHQAGYPKDELLARAEAVNARFVRPPLPADEVRQIVDSVTRYRR